MVWQFTEELVCWYIGPGMTDESLEFLKRQVQGGPLSCSYKWGPITPISRVVITPVKPIYFRPFIEVITPFITGRGPSCTGIRHKLINFKCHDWQLEGGGSHFNSAVFRDEQRSIQDSHFPFMAVDSIYIFVHFSHIFECQYETAKD